MATTLSQLSFSASGNDLSTLRGTTGAATGTIVTTGTDSAGEVFTSTISGVAISASSVSSSIASELSSALSAATDSGSLSSATSTDYSVLSSTTYTSFTAASTPPSTTSSSHLSTGAKVGIGVAVPVIAVIAAILLFAYLRRHRRAKKNPSPSNSSHQGTYEITDKPELSGTAYDPAIAGLVIPKSELPSTVGAKAPWLHVNTGYSSPELGHNPAASEVGFAALAGGGGGAGAGSTTVGDSTTSNSTSGAGAPASVRGSIARRPVSTVTDGEAEDLAEEADLLVQELGLIQMRKKALGGIAKGKGVKPEELPGTRGEDYRDLLVREARIRERIDEIDSARTGSASQK